MLENAKEKIEGKMEAKIELIIKKYKKAVVQKKQQICWKNR